MAIVTRHVDIEAVVRDMPSYSNRRDQGSRVEAALAAMAPERAERTRENLRYFGLWLAPPTRRSTPGSGRSRTGRSLRATSPACRT